MTKTTVIIAALVSAVVAINFSCMKTNDDKEELSSEIVKNPLSADNKELKQDELPKIFFPDTTYDFGNIVEGESVEHDFKFKNIGKSPLLIHSASGSCGCTVPSHPKNPIAPGEEGLIHVQYNSEGRLPGNQHKTITILTNAIPNYYTLGVHVNVIAKKQ